MKTGFAWIVALVASILFNGPLARADDVIRMTGDSLNFYVRNHPDEAPAVIEHVGNRAVTKCNW